MTRHSKPSKTAPVRSKKDELRRTLAQLIMKSDAPAQMIELHFWSRETGVLDVVRTFVALNESVKDALRAFLKLARDARTITAKIDSAGHLIMSAPHVTETFAQAAYLMAKPRNGHRGRIALPPNGGEERHQNRKRAGKAA